MKYRKEEIEAISKALKLQANLKSETAFENMNGFSIKPGSNSNYDKYLSKVMNYGKEN